VFLRALEKSLGPRSISEVGLAAPVAKPEGAHLSEFVSFFLFPLPLKILSVKKNTHNPKIDVTNSNRLAPPELAHT
jgi:hypothetical protein